MNTLDKVLGILQLAKTENWPYPKTFEELKSSGVKSYETSWKNGFQSSFCGDFGEIREPNSQELGSLTIAENYSEQAAKLALVNHQQGESTYFEWANQMAAAGVSHYRVNMEKRTVTYYSPNEDYYFTEAVPNPR